LVRSAVGHTSVNDSETAEVEPPTEPAAAPPRRQEGAPDRDRRIAPAAPLAAARPAGAPGTPAGRPLAGVGSRRRPGRPTGDPGGALRCGGEN